MSDANKLELLLKAKKAAYTKAIRKQINMIANCGTNPEWELFEKTFGWFQIKERFKFGQEDIDLYKELWNKEVNKLYKKIDQAGLDRKMYFDNQFMISQANRRDLDY